MTDNLSQQTLKYISPSSLDDRFAFITDSTLRKNIANTFSYIIFLDSLASENNIPSYLKIQIYKDIIIHTVSIVESILVWKLLEMKRIGTKICTDYESQNREYYYEKIKEIITIEDKCICACYVKPKEFKLDTNTQFIETIRMAKRCGLFNEDQFEEVDKLRQLRNKIHLAGLKDIDNQYDEKDVDKCFKVANEIIVMIEKY